MGVGEKGLLTGLAWHTQKNKLDRPDPMEEELFFNRNE